MTENEQMTGDELLPLCALGFLLLILVFLVPDAGHAQAKSFIEVASGARWDEFADWAAAWCRMKIILLTFGMSYLAYALFTTLPFWKPKLLSWFFPPLALVIMVGVWTGLYFLTKAVL